MKIYAAELTDTAAGADLDRLCAGLTRERQARIKKTVRRESARQILLAELVLRRAVSENLPLPVGKIAFDYNPYGKPFLVNAGGFHFNLSHSGRWVVCVIDSAPAGIDIELVKPVGYDLAGRFFSRLEYADLMARNEPERLNYFYALWTLKESYIKALGRGLFKSLDSFAIRINHDRIQRLETENEPGDWFFKQYEIDGDYKMSVCASHERFPAEVVIREWDYFI